MSRTFFLTAIATLLLGAAGIGAESSQTSIKWKVISGGGSKSSAAGLVLNATVGQTSTTYSTANAIALQAGFWQRQASSGSCCIGIRGDLNSDGTDNGVLDLTFMIDEIFRGGPPAACPEEADLNQDGSPSTVLDLTFLIDTIFRGGPDPGSC